MTKKRNDQDQRAALGRTPNGANDNRDTHQAPGEMQQSLFQHGHETSAKPTPRVRSPLVDETNYTSTQRDARVYMNVRAALARSEVVDEQSIEVRPRSGVVQLRGEVPTSDMRSLVKRIVAAVDGVEEIHDHLRVA